jgi:ParB-like chromosome segregation protein Spo0J
MTRVLTVARRPVTSEIVMSARTVLNIRSMSVTDLVPAPYNPRRLLKSGDPRYQKLVASLREFGLVEPLVWNETTGHVVGGHARLAILKELGTVRVPVSVVRLSPEREKALNVVLNNHEAQGRFDTEKLADLLEELGDLPEFELTGFDAGDLADLRPEPAADLLPDQEPTGVEVTLATDAATYERLAPRLDALIAEFDLICHVLRFGDE